MADIFSSSERSAIMRKIRSKDTKPEMQTRRYLHNLGFRYSLHKRSLPGCPDIVLTKYKTAIQVRGCFWHGHKQCIDGHIPKTRSRFWKEKIANNIRRDEMNDRELKKKGWQLIIIWECQCSSKKKFMIEINKVIGFLKSTSVELC